MALPWASLIRRHGLAGNTTITVSEQHKASPRKLVFIKYPQRRYQYGIEVLTSTGTTLTSFRISRTEAVALMHDLNEILEGDVK